MNHNHSRSIFDYHSANRCCLTISVCVCALISFLCRRTNSGDWIFIFQSKFFAIVRSSSTQVQGRTQKLSSDVQANGPFSIDVCCLNKKPMTLVIGLLLFFEWDIFLNSFKNLFLRSRLSSEINHIKLWKSMGISSQQNTVLLENNQEENELRPGQSRRDLDHLRWLSTHLWFQTKTTFAAEIVWDLTFLYWQSPNTSF